MGAWVRGVGSGVEGKVEGRGRGWTERTEEARFVPKSRLTNRTDTPSCGSRCKQRLTDSGQQALRKTSMHPPPPTPPPPRANTLRAHTLQAATTGVPFQKDAFGVAYLVL